MFITIVRIVVHRCPRHPGTSKPRLSVQRVSQGRFSAGSRRSAVERLERQTGGYGSGIGPGAPSNRALALHPGKGIAGVSLNA